jgi:hypothetical protein
VSWVTPHDKYKWLLSRIRYERDEKGNLVAVLKEDFGRRASGSLDAEIEAKVRAAKAGPKK